jgi:hypothetical protein
MFYIGLIIGLFIGANVGLILSGLLRNAKIEEEMLFSDASLQKTDMHYEI